MSSSAWVLRFGRRPTGSVGWVVHRADGTGPVYSSGPDEFEEARSMAIKLALRDDVPAVLVHVSADRSVVEEEIDR